MLPIFLNSPERIACSILASGSCEIPTESGEAVIQPSEVGCGTRPICAAIAVPRRPASRIKQILISEPYIPEHRKIAYGSVGLRVRASNSRVRLRNREKVSWQKADQADLLNEGAPTCRRASNRIRPFRR